MLTYERPSPLNDAQQSQVLDLCVFWDLPGPTEENKRWLYERLLSHAVIKNQGTWSVCGHDANLQLVYQDEIHVKTYFQKPLTSVFGCVVDDVAGAPMDVNVSIFIQNS